MKKYKFEISGLDCASCANNIEEKLHKIDIINNVNINFMMQKLTFECLEENINEALNKIEKILKKETVTIDRCDF